MSSEGHSLKQRCSRQSRAYAVVRAVETDASRGVDDALAARRESVFAARGPRSPEESSRLLGDRTAAKEEEEATTKKTAEGPEGRRHAGVRFDLQRVRGLFAMVFGCDKTGGHGRFFTRKRMHGD